MNLELEIDNLEIKDVFELEKQKLEKLGSLSDDVKTKLNNYIKRINTIEKIEFLPYHKLGEEKYKRMGIPYACDKIPAKDKDECNELYQRFMKLFETK